MSRRDLAADLALVTWVLVASGLYLWQFRTPVMNLLTRFLPHSQP